MPKRKFSNPLDELTDPTPNPTPKPRRKRFDAPTQSITTTDLQQASPDKLAAGQYRRKTITLPPAQLDYIKEIAHENHLSVLATYRWLIDIALDLYEDGERPQVEIRQIRGEALRKHWTSE